MNKIHNVQIIEFKKNSLHLVVDNKKYIFQLESISNRLLNATHVERNRFEVSPSGYGIHWPLLDEDLSIDGLLGIQNIPLQQKELVQI
ncbi:DUF2442 domain-containing protein [candidate division KSB1 bacterium]|nr:DUF2442 domain-containing protein [candidate division KSB1 bacterium]MBL7094422.1 DUF2442 domain-containing protein [candidate division KSB1 bacterium]